MSSDVKKDINLCKKLIKIAQTFISINYLINVKNTSSLDDTKYLFKY
jgi:hypothetical protein